LHGLVSAEGNGMGVIGEAAPKVFHGAEVEVPEPPGGPGKLKRDDAEAEGECLAGSEPSVEAESPGVKNDRRAEACSR